MAREITQRELEHFRADVDALLDQEPAPRG
jgi:hypothetical protein